MEHRLLKRLKYFRQVPIPENVCERSVASRAVPGPRRKVHETKSDDQEMVEKRSFVRFSERAGTLPL